jgi:hypothetical protein
MRGVRIEQVKTPSRMETKHNMINMIHVCFDLLLVYKYRAETYQSNMIQSYPVIEWVGHPSLQPHYPSTTLGAPFTRPHSLASQQIHANPTYS